MNKFLLPSEFCLDSGRRTHGGTQTWLRKRGNGSAWLRRAGFLAAIPWTLWASPQKALKNEKKNQMKSKLHTSSTATQLASNF